VYTKQALESQQQQALYTRLVEQYSTLVAKIAHHLAARLSSAVQIDDLIQAGMIGLFESSKTFDETKGASFETFAGIRIRGAMLDEVRRGDWAPRSVLKNNRTIATTIKKLEQEHGRSVFDQEIAKAIGIELNDYHAMLRDSVSVKLFSLNEQPFDDGDTTLDRIVSPGDAPAEIVEQANFAQQLAQEINRLPEKERLVLSLYYDEEFNLREIGEVLGVSESRVSQIHGQAAMRLRARLDCWRLED